MHSFKSRIGPSIIWNPVKTEPCMTSSFHETKTWDRTSKHHYNDIPTNMQRIIHKSAERRKLSAQCRLLCDDQVLARTITVITLRSFSVHKTWLTADIHLCVSPLAGCWLSYFKWHSRAELSRAELLTDCYRLSLSLSVSLSPTVGLFSTCRLCGELWPWLWLNNTVSHTNNHI